jgi:hypothetical protein
MPRLNGPSLGAPSWGFGPVDELLLVEFIPPPDWFMTPIGEGGATGAVSRYDCPGGSTGELEVAVEPIVVEVGRAVGSATEKSPTTLFVAPPAEILMAGPSSVSAPDPI